MSNKQIEKLWEEVREVSLGRRIPQLSTPPTPLEFLREYVSPNKPCIISNSINHWPALSLWSSTPYLLTSLSSPSPPVSLHLTPFGLADSPTPTPTPTPTPNPNSTPTPNPNSTPTPTPTPNPNPNSTPTTTPTSLCFATAHVEKLPFDKALSEVQESVKNKKVGYLQQQNDSFRSEYKGLEGDIEGDVPWATEAFGCFPEAVNIWVGNELSETSFHKDHYENMYAVVCGEKHFLLLPPTDVHRMYIRDYPAAQYHYSQDTGEFRLELEDPVRYVPWCSVNPYPSEMEKAKAVAEFPLYFNGLKPFEVTVKAGEMLYLPSMWFHHVRQSPDSRGLTVAINYWYDMKFDIKYAYFNFLQSLHWYSPRNSAFSHVGHDDGFQGIRKYLEEEDLDISASSVEH